jgi:thiaminase
MMKSDFREVLRAVSGDEKVARIRGLLESKNDELLRHAYFKRCHANQISREQLIAVVKQLYCFSVFFERILARRIAEYSTLKNFRIIQLARKHLSEEVGHAEMFRDCLVSNGVSSEEVANLAPAAFTKALFGYLTVTVQHESEYVSNVAIMQVMEGIGYNFFASTLKVMQSHGMLADAMIQHTDADEGHSLLGLDLVAEFDSATFSDCVRVIDDLYLLMGHVLDEWLGTQESKRSLGRVAEA